MRSKNWSFCVLVHVYWIVRPVFTNYQCSQIFTSLGLQQLNKYILKKKLLLMLVRLWSTLQHATSFHFILDLLYYALSQTIAHLVLVDGGTPLLRAQVTSHEVVHLLPQILISWLEKNGTCRFITHLKNGIFLYSLRKSHRYVDCYAVQLKLND